MIQSEDSHLGCVCPECGNRCTACLGTNSVMDREAVRALKGNPLLADAMLNRIMEPEFEDEEQDAPLRLSPAAHMVCPREAGGSI